LLFAGDLRRLSWRVVEPRCAPIRGLALNRVPPLQGGARCARL